MKKRKILLAGFMARMESGRLPPQVTFGELAERDGGQSGREKDWMPWHDRAALRMGQQGWTLAARQEGEWFGTAEVGAEKFNQAWRNKRSQQQQGDAG